MLAAIETHPSNRLSRGHCTDFPDAMYCLRRAAELEQCPEEERRATEALRLYRLHQAACARERHDLERRQRRHFAALLRAEGSDDLADAYEAGRYERLAI